jgi:hypothetical protein
MHEFTVQMNHERMVQKVLRLKKWYEYAVNIITKITYLKLMLKVEFYVRKVKVAA